MSGTAQEGDNTLKSLLLEQLEYTHHKENWFAPTNTALEGVTAEQSNWQDSTTNHSIGQLVSYLVFWNERVLLAFKGIKLPDFVENNDATFVKYDELEWPLLTNRLDNIQTVWEQQV